MNTRLIVSFNNPARIKIINGLKLLPTESSLAAPITAVIKMEWLKKIFSIKPCI
jgi:hypothetical protein